MSYGTFIDDTNREEEPLMNRQGVLWFKNEVELAEWQNENPTFRILSIELKERVVPWGDDVQKQQQLFVHYEY